MPRRSPQPRVHRGPVPDQPIGHRKQRQATRISDCIRFKFHEQDESWQPIFHKQAIAMCHEMERRGRLRDDGTYIPVDAGPARGRRNTSVVDDEIALFPVSFGLHDYPGQTFSLVPSDSYVGKDGTVYLQVAEIVGKSWRPFALGTADQLRTEITDAPRQGLLAAFQFGRLIRRARP